MTAFKQTSGAAAGAARRNGVVGQVSARTVTVGRLSAALSISLSVMLGGTLAGWHGAAMAADVAEVAVVIRNHRFEPAEIKVPAGRKVKLVLSNLDATPEEFESHELKREKLIPAGAKATVYVGPLEKGRYPFFGEFNQATAQGVVVVE